jgi:alkaline phosphatase D
LAAQNPEYLVLIGDNVYVDLVNKIKTTDVDPKILWNRYVDLRLSLPFYFQKKLIPTHALWDDHDYGMNDGTSDFTYKEEAKDTFTAFWAQDLSEEDWSKGYGVGGLLSLGDFNLYFLDGRTYRSPETSGKHLGLEQSAWLYSKLKEEETPSLIIKGDQFFGGHHSYESFEGKHPEDFQAFVTELKQLKTPFVFLSGDRHLSEIMQFPRTLFGKPGFEITSSPLHGEVFQDTSSNPWRVVSTNGKVNFTIIDNLAQENHWFMDVTNIGENGEVHFKRELAVYIKDLQDNLKEVRKRRYGKRRYRRIRSKR